VTETNCARVRGSFETRAHSTQHFSLEGALLDRVDVRRDTLATFIDFDLNTY
jgi:hypothetical protein